ncbi:conserved telomere maintenance component 1 [Hibiscus trionum]|uniref:CST complex subunit CTC1 n=1 Tax=Hibiscus trionum TaxID=183268 RepID=A0A9W7MC01_HIBTR|nr:conserved telomere maintenance component 1 [Hibiscus trionum]
MQDLKILTVSDLLRYGRSHTGSSTPGPPIISDQNPQPPPGPSTSDPNGDPKPLPQFGYPAILVGTLRLPTLTLKCPHENCLEFSDGSVAVCCDIVGFDLRAIGKKIHVLTWNFIISDHLSSGFLEIVEWDLSDSSHGLSRCSSLIIDSFPLASNLIECIPKTSNAKSYRIHGIIGEVSPVSVVPCSVKDPSSSKSMNLRGFQVRIMTCECKLCRLKESVSVLFGATDRHSFTSPVFVYFCGPAWCWHPALTKLIGNIVTISGLMKKLILMGDQESVLMLVTAENTVLHLPKLLKKRKVVCGSYIGTVKNVYMQGMVVELDEEVWLLLTNQSLKPPHGLRIGAVISIRNVHDVVPQFSWAKFRVLGACFNTSIVVKSFSPLKTRCLIASQSQSQLGNFIEALGFSTRLWVLLLVSCFQKAFSGILSQKDILGSRHNKGLVQIFANSHLDTSVFQARHGVLMEFSKHESCCTATEPYHGNLKLVVPISGFIHHCEIFWIKALLPSDNILPVSCVGKYYQRSKRKAFRSEDLGISLVGMLKMSPSFGRLQLVDMSGTIDVVVPDLPSFWDPNTIFEVIDYFLFVEGMPESKHPELSSDDSSLPRSIFQGFSFARKPNLKIFVYFHLRNATCRNRPIYPTIASEDELNDTNSGKFHLIYITRKFRPPRHSMKLERYAFAEAIVMPWYLFLAGKDGSMHQDKVLIDCTIGNHADHSSSKRQKTDCASSLSGPGFKDNFCSVCFEKGTSLRETCGDQSCLRTGFSHEIPCSATIQCVNNFIFTSSGTLYRIKADAKIKVCKGSAKKVFLSFSSESNLKYQLLQIGGFHLMKHHHKEGPLCNIKDTGLKVVPITSGTYLRRLSFSSEVLTTDKSLHNSSLCNDVITNDQVLAVASGSSISDIHLHVSSSLTGLFESDIKELRNDQNANLGNFSLSLRMKTRMNVNLEENLGLLDHSCLFPARIFTSLRGDIIAVHSFDQGSSDMCSNREDYGDLHPYGSCDRTKNRCIHVLVANQIVKIFGFVNQYLFPTGFGPGINATFHQILDLGPRVPSTLMLTFESSIVINSIRAVNETYSSDGNLKRFRCRVAAVHVLVLEKSNRKCDDLNSNTQSRPLSVDIPLACFILDDGSCSWCCWANAERAATMLRLEECSVSGYEANVYKRRRVGVENTVTASTMHHLQRILEKHNKITVKSTRSVFDPFDQDFTVTAGSGRALTGLDDDFDLLATIIMNACINSFWTVVTEVMDSNAVNLLNDHLVEMQMPMLPMENLWATEVWSVDPLTEAREMVQNNYNPCSLQVHAKQVVER